MRIRHLSVLVACLGACAQAQPTSSSSAASDSAAHRAHEAYVEAINSNNVDSLMEMLTDDVVFLSANEPVMVGKAAVRPWVAGYYDAYRTHWDKPVQEFVVNGDWAFERYAYVATDSSRTDTSVAQSTGWGLAIYRRSADGKWRVARDAFGPDHPPAGG